MLGNPPGTFFTSNSMHFSSKMYFNIYLILFVKQENNVFIHKFTFLYFFMNQMSKSEKVKIRTITVITPPIRQANYEENNETVAFRSLSFK